MSTSPRPLTDPRRQLALVVAIVLVFGASALLPSSARATDALTPSETVLATRYAPVAMLKKQSAPCDRSGEQFAPSPVQIVLGNPTVKLLRGPSGHRSGFTTIATGPGVADIAGLGSNYYLDLPGNPINPGCTYERASRALMRGRQPTVYAHIAHEAGIKGVALQYWFFYYFNQFNDLHEGDWEMIQLAWDGTTSVQGALSRPPDRIALAQHGGGETATWAEPKLRRSGDHPVVYPASGSHATYYAPELYLGTGQNGSGFGCDDSRSPSDRVPTDAVLVPDAPTASGAAAWLTYEGKWGQYEPGLNNGPEGPMQHAQWREPFRWMDGLRSSSPTVPLGSTFGPSVTGSFCGVIATGSVYYNKLSKSPWIILILVGAIVLLVVIVARRTRWTPAPAEPLDQPRRAGQMIVAATQVYRRHWRVFLAMGAIFVPISAGSALLQHLLFHVSGIHALLESTDSRRTGAVIGVIAGSFGTTVAYTLVVALVSATVDDILEERSIGVLSPCRTLLRRLGTLIAAQALVTAMLVVLSLTIIGLPLAFKKAVDWALTPWEVVVGRRSPRDALRASRMKVSRRWWKTAGLTVILIAAALALGPLVGFLLIFATPAPLVLINTMGSVVYALVVPYTAIVLSLLYLDLRSRRDAVSSTITERRRIGARRQATNEP